MDVKVGGVPRSRSTINKLYARLRQGAEFDLILTDIVMPGSLQGPALAEEILLLRPKSQILFMSGYPNEAAVGSQGLPNSTVVLQKPLAKGKLLAAVEKALATAAHSDIPT